MGIATGWERYWGSSGDMVLSRLEDDVRDAQGSDGVDFGAALKFGREIDMIVSDRTGVRLVVWMMKWQIAYCTGDVRFSISDINAM